MRRIVVAALGMAAAAVLVSAPAASAFTVHPDQCIGRYPICPLGTTL